MESSNASRRGFNRWVKMGILALNSEELELEMSSPLEPAT